MAYHAQSLHVVLRPQTARPQRDPVAGAGWGCWLGVPTCVLREQESSEPSGSAPLDALPLLGPGGEGRESRE